MKEDWKSQGEAIKALNDAETANASGGDYNEVEVMFCHSCNVEKKDVWNYTDNGEGPYKCPFCHEINMFHEDGETRRHYK